MFREVIIKESITEEEINENTLMYGLLKDIVSKIGGLNAPSLRRVARLVNNIDKSEEEVRKINMG